MFMALLQTQSLPYSYKITNNLSILQLRNTIILLYTPSLVIVTIVTPY